MKAPEHSPAARQDPRQTCPFCHFEWTGPRARKSDQCPRCQKTIWHEPKIRAILDFRS